jgi:uncharacterized OB-fold protein
MPDAFIRTVAQKVDVIRPKPSPDAVSSGFWDAAARGKLAIQRCTDCRTFQHPPRPLCRACGGTDLRFEEVSGKGKLWSWTITHRSVLNGFETAVPYTCLIVELLEQKNLFLLSDLIGRDAEGEFRVGMPMHVVFLDTGKAGPLLPQFAADGQEKRS